MSFFDKMERRFRRKAIPNLMLYLVILFIAGFVLDIVSPTFYSDYLSLNMYYILHGQVWRLVTYIVAPPSDNVLWFLLFTYILYSLGRTLERLWGSFYFNVYIFIGYLMNILAAALIYIVSNMNLALTLSNMSLSLILALAITIPDMTFFLYGIIPIKARYLGWFYLATVAFECFQMISGGYWFMCIGVVAPLVNVAVFYFVIRKPAARVRQAIRKAEFDRKVKAVERESRNTTRHCCAICGKTEVTAPEMEFRYCSKCAGGKEYCMDHLYTHVHLTEEGSYPKL